MIAAMMNIFKSLFRHLAPKPPVVRRPSSPPRKLPPGWPEKLPSRPLGPNDTNYKGF